MSSSCPFCHLNIPISQLEWHANNHLVEDELARDFELAQHIALAPPSPRFTDVTTNFSEVSEDSSELAPKCSIPRFDCNSSNYGKSFDQAKISCLVSLQTRSIFHKVEDGLMVLLRRCLDMESGNSRSVISGHVDHFQSIESEDFGWGCGWRNIQMLSSHLLFQRQEAREVMFGGSGFVPDISSLQRWLEIAWERGFDTLGSDSFNHKVYGSKKWIGTTECATLFRSFGLRARVVDFDGKSTESLSLTVDNAEQRDLSVQSNSRRCKGKSRVEQVSGPMDKFLLGRQYDICKAGHVLDENYGHNVFANFCNDGHTPIDHDKYDKCSRKTSGHHILVDWVWNYFTNGVFDRSVQRVIVSEKMPLYFQHDGHSRTIVGIQMQKGLHGMPDRYNLLILDPGQRTTDLERSLREKTGWQKLIKRGVHTLKKPQYQLCYVNPGIAHGEEMGQLKAIESVLIKI